MRDSIFRVVFLAFRFAFKTVALFLVPIVNKRGPINYNSIYENMESLNYALYLPKTC